MKFTKKILALLLTLVMAMGMLVGCTSQTSSTTSSDAQTAQTTIDENGTYTSKEEVAEYIATYDKLPSNYITKKEAQSLGWKTEGTLDEVASGKSIGGDYFGNYEGALPEVAGREYHECDIDYVEGNRNAKRIIYSNDRNIYYTDDHYKTFEHLYGDDDYGN